MMLLPLLLWIASNRSWNWLHVPPAIAAWSALCAFLMISSLATFSWTSMRLRRNVRFTAIVVIALVAGALVSAPWETLSILTIVYAATIPFSMLAYSKVKRQRRAGHKPEPAAPAA
jgi:CDP-diacylglycerol--serine O-phosphatidyltransferase